MNDPLDAIREITPPVDPQPELLARVRSELMTTIDESKSHQPGAAGGGGRRAKGRGIGMIAGAAAIVLMAGAAVVAVTGGSDSADTTNLQCRDKSGVDDVAIVNAITGDPVVDCSKVWRDAYGSEPPAMVAYDNGTGGVAVLLVGDPVPEGYTALESGAYQDTALIELEETLQDLGSGLSAGCYDEANARAMVQSDLDRLGLDTWDVTVDASRSQPDGIKVCAGGMAMPEQNTVSISGGPSGDLGAYTEFAKALHAGLKAECSNLDEAEELTRSIAASAPDFETPGYEPIAILDAGLGIESVVDPTASCTRVSTTVGGSMSIVLRGPSA